MKSSSSSPLMADETISSSPSRSGLATDAGSPRRDAKMKERAERRKKRDKRLADSNASRQASAASSSREKKKSEPKLSQAEQDAIDSKLGCCYHTGQFLARAIHLIDALIGVVFIVYGFLIYFNFENPAIEACVVSLSFGWAMFLISMFGIIGFATKVCHRVGLVISAYLAPFIALWYLFIIIALLASPDVYFDYLTENKDVMYLTDAKIATLRNLIPMFCIILGCLAAVEIARFVIGRKLRHKLLRYDSASERIAASSTSEQSHSSRRSKKSSRDDDMTEPLILGSDEEV